MDVTHLPNPIRTNTWSPTNETLNIYKETYMHKVLLIINREEKSSINILYTGQCKKKSYRPGSF